MFENLGDRLQNVMNKIKGYGKITEENISEMTREIRLALLEADVNYKVVKEFITNVKEKALGEEVAKSLMLTVDPIFISPLSGFICPAIILSSAVLAISLPPIKAILSSGRIVKFKFLIITSPSRL